MEIIVKLINWTQRNITSLAYSCHKCECCKIDFAKIFNWNMKSTSVNWSVSVKFRTNHSIIIDKLIGFSDSRGKELKRGTIRREYRGNIFITCLVVTDVDSFQSNLCIIWTVRTDKPITDDGRYINTSKYTGVDYFSKFRVRTDSENVGGVRIYWRFTGDYRSYDICSESFPAASLPSSSRCFQFLAAWGIVENAEIRHEW